MSVYNKKKDNVIEALAIAGISISLFSFIQIMGLARHLNFYLIMLITSYLAAMVGYFLYYRMKKVSFWFLLFAAVVSLLCGVALFTIPHIIFLNVLYFVFNGVAFGIMWQFNHMDYMSKVTAYKSAMESDNIENEYY